MFIPILAALAGAGASWGLNKLDQSGAPGAGTPENYGRIRTGTKEASNFQKQLFQSGGGLPQQPLYQQGAERLNQLFNQTPQTFEQFASPYQENYQEQALPDLLSRFGGFGGTGSGAFGSSAFLNSIAQSQRGLQRDLSQMYSQYQNQNQMNAIPQALQYAQGPLTNQINALNYSPYQTTHQQRQPGFYDSLAQIAPSAIQSSLNGLFNTNQQPNAFQSGGIGSQGNYNPNLYG